MSGLQDTEQTLQPPTDNAEFKTSNQPPNRDLTLQPSGDDAGRSSEHPPERDLDLQPPQGAGTATTSKSESEALNLQPASDNYTKPNAQSGSHDPDLGLQPPENNAAENTGADTALQPTSGDTPNTSSGTYDSTESTKNPLKKVANFFKDQGHKKSDGPPSMENDA